MSHQDADLDLLTAVHGLSQRRIDLVSRAAGEWRQQLVDVTGRNNLLRFRELKLGTIDLGKAEPEAVAHLLRGYGVKISTLYVVPADRDAALRRIRAIHRKAGENFEERGVRTLHLACGLATWENKRIAWEPAAPVLLRAAELHPLGAAQDDFEIILVDEMEANPVLLHVLKSEYRCVVDAASLLEKVDGVIDQPWELQAAYDWLAEQASGIAGFRVVPSLVLANFSYAKLPMVRDLEDHLEELVAHDLIAAIAGDEEAQEQVRLSQPVPEDIPAPDHIPPADEFLVLDADASQNYAINSVLAGESLIVKGPPGTGKSQTIANLIGSLVARGQTVLFVAEKRAAIDAVFKRLHQQHLDDLLLDLHGGAGSRRALAQVIGQALSATRTVPRVDRSAEQRALVRQRDELNGYVEALHRPREPWVVSVYEARAEVAGIPDGARTDVRFRDDVLQRLGAADEEQARLQLQELVRLAGASSRKSPWADATITTEEESRLAFALVDGLRRQTLPQMVRQLSEAAAETSLTPSSSTSGWTARMELWTRVAEQLRSFRPEVYGADLAALAEDLGSHGGGFSRFWAGLTSARYRGARKQVRSLLVDGASGRIVPGDVVQAAQANVDRCRQLGGTVPTVPSDLDDLRALHEQVTAQLAELGRITGHVSLVDLPTAELAGLLDALVADRATLARIPVIRGLQSSLRDAGLQEFVEEIIRRQPSEETSVQALRHAWLESILDHVILSDPVIGAFSADKHERVAEEFQVSDRSHIASSAPRIRRLAAEHATRARDHFKEQEQILLRQSALKRRHMAVRSLFEATPDVLLALKPCWAMSPLVVSQLLPPRPLFDVVVFDEASQITPADAITSILRGKQLVVAGDERQLPPTAFFVSESSGDQEEEEADAELEVPLLAGTKGFESVLDALTFLLRFRMLEWHYRSRDERLIAFSNAHLYHGGLTTFPGVGGETCLGHVLAPWEPGSDTNSPSAEVEAVVDLILEQATVHPADSLGVITMGIKHANRIDETLRLRLRDHPELEAFFDETREERFFVKNLERVQGDERDAIILSIGYGKDGNGRLQYRFGPLLTEGGERRLNVAITRAKKRLTLVSSFTSADMDPDKLNSQGMRLVRDYLQYIESGGASLGDAVMDKPALNPFEVDVLQTLQQHFALTPQYGVSGYWIDFAAHHPTEPGRYVLAIECDGATYHSSESARDRDRLRQEQLERIGWRFHRIWSGDWFHDKQRAVARVVAAYRQALADAEGVGAVDPVRPIVTASPVLPEQAGAGQRFGIRPSISPGFPITGYPHRQLVALARWIESDGQLRTEDEVLAEMMHQLGFDRRGVRIVAALTAAIRAARRTP